MYFFFLSSVKKQRNNRVRDTSTLLTGRQFNAMRFFKITFKPFYYKFSLGSGARGGIEIEFRKAGW